MRDRFPGLVEKGRLLTGDYASPPGARYGAFFVKHPKSGNLFRFLAADADATTWQAMGLPLPPWEHVSLALVAGDRLPTWLEMCWAKGLFWEPEECVVQFHPPESEYVNTHPMVLHLWKAVGVEFPRPPKGTVG